MTGRAEPVGSELWGPFISAHRDDYERRSSATGTHALVIGVSRYPTLESNSVWGMQPLTSAVASATLFARWLNSSFNSARNAPLRSLRFLASPSPREAEAYATDLKDVPRATSSNVDEALRRWIIDCKSTKDNTALLYVAGHGVFDTRSGSSLLLEDLDNELYLGRSVNVSAVITNLEFIPNLEASYVFVDACQDIMNTQREYGGAGLCFPHSFRPGGRKGGYVYPSAAIGTRAYGLPGQGSVFSRKLIQSLDRGALEYSAALDAWVVTSHGLAREMSYFADEHPDQKPFPDPAGAVLAFHLPRNPPTCAVSLNIAPAISAASFDVVIKDSDDVPEIPATTFDPNPLLIEDLPPGLHVVALTPLGSATSRPVQRVRDIMPYETAVCEFEGL